MTLGAAPRGRVFAATRPTDLRKSFDTLAHLVREDLGHEPASGDLYLFINKRRTRAKVLFYDGTGLCLFIKRLEQGRFAAPWERAHEGALRMSRAELALFLEGSPVVFVGRLSPEEVVPGRVARSSLLV